MGMSDKQFDTLMRFILDEINEALEVMPEGKEKERLAKAASNLQKALED